jgi:hypothetical protein
MSGRIYFSVAINDNLVTVLVSLRAAHVNYGLSAEYRMSARQTQWLLESLTAREMIL